MLGFGPASAESQRRSDEIDGPSWLLHVIYAATYEAAMQAHYDRLGWGTYKPVPGVTDRPYDQDELEQQLSDFPGDSDLRHLNGLTD